MIIAFNRLTAAVTYYGLWALLLMWEAVALILRAQGHRVGTISMVARDQGWNAVVIPYLWGGMASHWWFPATRAGGAATSVAYWLIAVGLLAWDVSRWGAPASGLMLWLRFPFMWLVVGFVAAGLLFAQTGVAPWRR